MGDLNVDTSAGMRNEQNNFNFLKDICSTINLFNIVIEFTRIDRRIGLYWKAALDRVFTNIPESTVKIIEIHLSDYTYQTNNFQLSVTTIKENTTPEISLKATCEMFATSFKRNPIYS